MRNEHVRPGLRHLLGFLGKEHVGAGEQAHFAGRRDHVHFLVEAHAGLFESDANGAVEEADGGEVLHAAEPGISHVLQEALHNAKGIGAADAGEHGRAFDDG